MAVVDHELASQYILIAFGGVVVLSYIFDLLARKARLPSVLLLMAVGVVARYVCLHFRLTIPALETILPVVGTVGLILIVLEGTLELQISRGALPTIARAGGCALFILLLTAFAVAGAFAGLLGEPFAISFANALPFAVISSAIAIPGAALLPQKKREFIVYESALSDILGIMVFSFAVQSITVKGTSVLGLAAALPTTLLVSLPCIAILFVLVVKNPHHVKFYLVLSSLILIYGTTKIFHLPSLLVVFLFGLFFANANQVIGVWRLRRFFREHQVKLETRFLKLVTAESAFLVRTFFFTLFGFSIDLFTFTAESILLGVCVTCITIAVRYVYLRIFAHVHLFPEIFVAPRGLVTVLLFYSLPTSLLLSGVTRQTLFVVILLTSLLMTISLLVYRPAGGGDAPEDALSGGLSEVAGEGELQDGMVPVLADATRLSERRN